MQGKPTDAIRFLIGDPLTASRMTKLQMGSALYAPLSLLVVADERGGTYLEYDRPSTLLSQFEDPGVAKVARELGDKARSTHPLGHGHRGKAVLSFTDRQRALPA